MGQIGRIVIAVVHRRTDAHRDTRQRQRAAVEVLAPTARFKAEMLITAGTRNIKRTCSGERIINRDVARRVRSQVKRRTRTRKFNDARAEVVVYLGSAREEVRICRNVNVAAKTAIGAVDVNGRCIGSVADLKTATTRQHIGEGRILISVVENQSRTARKTNAARAKALRIVNGRRVARKHADRCREARIGADDIGLRRRAEECNGTAARKRTALRRLDGADLSALVVESNIATRNRQKRRCTEGVRLPERDGAGRNRRRARISILLITLNRNVSRKRQITRTSYERGKTGVISVRSIQNEADIGINQIDLRELQIAVDLFAFRVDTDRTAPGTVSNDIRRVAVIEDVTFNERTAGDVELSTFGRLVLTRILNKDLPNALIAVGAKNIGRTRENNPARFNRGVRCKRDIARHNKLCVAGIGKCRLMCAKRAAFQDQVAKRPCRAVLQIDYGAARKDEGRRAKHSLGIGVVGKLQQRVLKDKASAVGCICRRVSKGERIARAAEIDGKSTALPAGHARGERGRTVSIERKGRTAPEVHGARAGKSANRLPDAVFETDGSIVADSKARCRTQSVVGVKPKRDASIHSNGSIKVIRLT